MCGILITKKECFTVNALVDKKETAVALMMRFYGFFPKKAAQQNLCLKHFVVFVNHLFLFDF